MTDPMTTAQFEALLGADPLNQDPAFLAAAHATAERQSAWQAACAFEHQLRAELNAVPVPATLMTQLLDLAEDPATVAAATLAAANDSWLRRCLPVAAVLMLALGMSWYFQLDANLALQKDIFAHVYAEAPFTRINSHQILLDELNAHLEASLGAHLVTSSAIEKLQVTFVKDCRIAKRLGTHLVLQGERGPINVLVLPATMVAQETSIGDARLRGKISPSAGGTLVVIGDQQDPIDEYLRVLNSSLKWEY